MKLLTNTIMILTLLYAGAYIGPKRLNKAASVSAKKVANVTKTVFSHIKGMKEEGK